MRLSPLDKKVIEAFVHKKDLSPEQSLLSTDGRSLLKHGMGGEKVAVWRGPQIAIVSTVSAKSDEVVIRYLTKVAGKGLVTWEGLKFQTGGDALYRGQWDGWILAFVPGRSKPVGRLDWSEYNGSYQVKMVEVEPEFRRSGIATAMYRKLFKDQGISKRDLVPSMRTPEGDAFRRYAPIAHRVAERYAGQIVHINDPWVDKMRKDFLTLMKNIPRVKDYKTAIELKEAMNRWAQFFNEVFFERFLNKSLKYDNTIREDVRAYIDRKLRKPAWDLYIEMSLPIARADDFWSEDARFRQFEREVRPWNQRIRRKAQVFWRELRDAILYYEDPEHKIRYRGEDEPPSLQAEVPIQERQVLEGFQVIMKGYEDDEWRRETLGAIRAGLRIYRRNAKQRLPILLQKQLPVIVEFEATLDKGGEYNHNGTITLYASSVSGKGPNWAAHVMAHEMGHHLWRSYLSGGAQEFWRTAIKGDYGSLDIQKLVDNWPGDAWAFEFPKLLGTTNPLLALQVDALSHDPAYSSGREGLQSKEDFQKLLDRGETTLRVPKTPITGYANKNPEEAFCEAIGLLVSYGPRAVHKKVRSWLDIVLPGQVKLAMARRVADRFAAAIGDPVKLLSAFKDALDYLARLENVVPQLQHGLEVLEAARAGKIDLTDPEMAGVVKTWRETLREFRIVPKIAFDRARYSGASNLFMALLQQYDMPNTTRRVIERAARSFNRVRMQKPSDVKAAEVYVKMLRDWRAWYAAAADALAHGKLHDESTTKLQAGSFTIVNTGGFSNDVVKETAQVVEKAAQALRSHGLGRVCYGEVLLANTIGRSSRILAFYLKEKDELFVRANLKGKKSAAIETLIHELGHRLHFRFLKGKNREIHAIYQRIAGNDHSQLMELAQTNRPKPGDTIVSGGKTYEVTNIGYRRGLTVELQRVDDPATKAHVSLEGWLEMKGVVPPGGAFVSAYAKKNYEENFAEMIVHYCLGTLPPDQVKMLEEVL